MGGACDQEKKNLWSNTQHSIQETLLSDVRFCSSGQWSSQVIFIGRAQFINIPPIVRKTDFLLDF